jgi:hypothetical protein
MGSILASGAVFVLGLTAMGVWANLDTVGWREARSVNWQVLLVLAGCAIAGLLGWRIAGLGPDQPG